MKKGIMNDFLVLVGLEEEQEFRIEELMKNCKEKYRFVDSEIRKYSQEFSDNDDFTWEWADDRESVDIIIGLLYGNYKAITTSIPEYGDKYFYLEADGTKTLTIWRGRSKDYYCYTAGNYFLPETVISEGYKELILREMKQDCPCG